MSQPTPFRFSMKKDASTWYYYDQAAGVLESPTPVYLRHAPKGWKETEMSWVRSDGYKGLFRSITSPYEFVIDGAAIVRYLFAAGVADAVCLFEIERSDPDTYEYESFFSGTLDFQTYTDRGTGVTLAMLASGLAHDLPQNNNIPYDIPIAGPAALSVFMDGIILKTEYRYIAPDSFSGTFNANDKVLPFLANVAYDTGDYFGREIVSSRQTLAVFSASGMAANNFPAGTNNLLRLFDIDIAQDITLKADVLYHPSTVNQPVKWAFYLMKVFNNGTQFQFAGLFQDSATVNNGTTRTFNVNVTLPGMTLDRNAAYLLAFTAEHPANPSNGENVLFTISNLELSITGNARLPQSNTTGYRYFDAASKLADLISGGTNTLVSSFLSDPAAVDYDNRPYNTILTSGDALRLIDSPALRLTWNDVWQDMSSRWMLGLSVQNEQIFIEPLAAFFDQNTIIADLGNAISCAIEPDIRQYFNTGKWGYENQDYGSLNGRDEFNTTQFYKYPPRTIQREQEMVSPFRPDMYGIEYTRANLIGKNTTDDKTDNEVFLLEIDTTQQTSGAYDLYRPQNGPAGSATGLLFPGTAYNLTLSPKRNLLRNGPLLHSFLKDGTKTITFQITDKNAELISDLGSGPVVEKADIAVSSLPTPLYQPVVFHVEAMTPINMAALMATHPAGCFQFTWKGVTLKGFPMEVGIKDAQRNTYQMSLICTLDTDLTALPLV